MILYVVVCKLCLVKFLVIDGMIFWYIFRGSSFGIFLIKFKSDGFFLIVVCKWVFSVFKGCIIFVVVVEVRLFVNVVWVVIVMLLVFGGALNCIIVVVSNYNFDGLVLCVILWGMSIKKLWNWLYVM